MGRRSPIRPPASAPFGTFPPLETTGSLAGAGGIGGAPARVTGGAGCSNGSRMEALAGAGVDHCAGYAAVIRRLVDIRQDDFVGFRHQVRRIEILAVDQR